ncbi:MAG: dihydroorotate dehydrogenase-like protein [Planctomycetota bacterium]|jgi:dihydroorotate dehydrogenase (fumarate)
MTIDLTTHYLGLTLRNPLVVASSPLTGRPDLLRQLEEAGAAAVVLPSLSEWRLKRHELEVHHLQESGTESFPEALSYFPELPDYGTGPDRFLRLVGEAKRALEIPVIGSLEGHSPGGWVRYAKEIESAGADALELNLHHTETNPLCTGGEVEEAYVGLVASVRASVSIPLSVKILPHFTAPAHVAKRFNEAGATGVVLFHRFPQPDIDLETLEVRLTRTPSNSYDVFLPLRWIALLRDALPVSLAASGGAHTAQDVLKLLLAGADVVQLTSALRARGPQHLTRLLEGIEAWLMENEYLSVEQMRGSMSRLNCSDSRPYEREDYDLVPPSLPVGEQEKRR